MSDANSIWLVYFASGGYDVCYSQQRVDELLVRYPDSKVVLYREYESTRAANTRPPVIEGTE